MGLKHKKYVYVLRDDGWYVKVRVIKSAPEDSIERYMPVGPKTKKPPLTATIIKEEQLPPEARSKLYQL